LIPFDDELMLIQITAGNRAIFSSFFACVQEIELRRDVTDFNLPD